MNVIIGWSRMEVGTGRGIVTVLRTLFDRQDARTFLTKLRTSRDADQTWWTSIPEDDPTTLDRLASIMSDSPAICPRCGRDAYVCQAIGCEADLLPASMDQSFAVQVTAGS